MSTHSHEHTHSHTHGEACEHSHAHTHEHSHNGEHTHTHEGHAHEGCGEHNHSHAEESHEHSHEHGHTHTHADGTTHTHDHIHEAVGAEHKDSEILGLLLDHWASHNQDHAKEYRKWMEKMTASGNEDVAQCIGEAIELMAKADTHLMEAKKKLVQA